MFIIEIKNLNNIIRQRLFTASGQENGAGAAGLQGFIICHLFEHIGEIIYQKDIEQTLNVRKSTITEALNNMERSKLIERHIDSNDKRLKRIVLTESGKELNKKMLINLEAIEQETLNGIDEVELALVNKIIAKIKKNLLVIEKE